jgi:hypothetical protein
MCLFFFLPIITETLISEGKLRNFTSGGIPDNCGLRGVLWRLLIRYLPLDTTLWKETLNTKRKLYESYKVCYLYNLYIV